MTTTQGMFDPSRYMMRLPKRVRDANGGWKQVEQDYLEVKWRLVWLRTEHPEAAIVTELMEHHDELAVFRARVDIPAGGSSTGWGSETSHDFGDYIEKAETKALGRALAALGYGTQFGEDFDFDAGAKTETTKVVDSPVQRQQSNGNGAAPQNVTRMPQGSAVPQSDVRQGRGGDSLPTATEPQIKAIYAIARGTLALAEEELDARCRERYGNPPQQLTRRQASEFIDALKLSVAGSTS